MSRYSIIPADAVDDPRVTDLHLRILTLFGKASDNNGWLRVNQRLVAERVGRSRETINRAIRELVDMGYVRKQARFSGKDGRQMINDYQVVMDRADPRGADEEIQPEGESQSPPCDAHVTPPCDVQITGGVISRRHTPCDLQTSHHKNDPLLQRPLSPSPEEEAAPSRARDPSPDIVERMGELCAALGVTDETKSPGLLSLSEPLRWANAGCDIDLDILPALRVIGARGIRPRSWQYCAQSVFEARDRRTAPPPAPNYPAEPPPRARGSPLLGQGFVGYLNERAEGGFHERDQHDGPTLEAGHGSRD